MPVEQLGLLLVVACIVAIISRRLNLPYSVGLVAAGIGLALLNVSGNLVLTRDLIFTVLLPPLIFEAALQLKWQPFRDDLLVTLTLAFPGVLLAGAIVAAGMHVLVRCRRLGSESDQEISSAIERLIRSQGHHVVVPAPLDCCRLSEGLHGPHAA